MLPLYRLSWLKGINPAKFGEKYGFFFAEKQCYHVLKSYGASSTRNHGKISDKAASLDIKNLDFFLAVKKCSVAIKFRSLMEDGV